MICLVYMIKNDKIRFCWKIGIFWEKSPQQIFLDFLSKSSPLTFSMSWKLLVFKLRPKISSVNQIWVFFNLQYILTGWIWLWFFRGRNTSIKRAIRVCYFGMRMREHPLNYWDSVLLLSLSFNCFNFLVWFSGLQIDISERKSKFLNRIY